MVENFPLLAIPVWVANYIKWRLLGLQMPNVGRDIPRISKRVRIINPRQIRLHSHTKLHPYSMVRSVPGRIEIGPRTGVGDYAIVNSAKLVSIGADVMIAAGCHITDANHGIERREKIQNQERRTDPVMIEDEVWLGAGVTVTAGVRIGKGAVVGAGAVVTRSVDPYQIVAGVPARPIGER